MELNRHIYKKDKGLIELSVDTKENSLSIRAFDFKGNHLNSNTIKMDLDILPDLVDVLVDLQNLPPEKSD
jgi:hypothetical protein